jgi:homoserine O-acetyltransferase
MTENDFDLYDLGDLELKSGSILPKAQIAYKTFGDPKNPAIIYPSWYSGSLSPASSLIHTMLLTYQQQSPTMSGSLVRTKH